MNYIPDKEITIVNTRQLFWLKRLSEKRGEAKWKFLEQFTQREKKRFLKIKEL